MLSRLTAKPPRPQCRPLLMTSVCLTAGLHRTLTLLVRSWRLLGTPLAAHGMEEFHNEAVMSDEEMVESSSGSLADWEGRAHSLEVWLPRARLAFAIITPSEVCTNATPFIRSAIASVLPEASVLLVPSWRGAMVLRFATPAERELARSFSPILFEGGSWRLRGAGEPQPLLPLARLAIAGGGDGVPARALG
jgi:hypothetical protein